MYFIVRTISLLGDVCVVESGARVSRLNSTCGDESRRCAPLFSFGPNPWCLPLDGRRKSPDDFLPVSVSEFVYALNEFYFIHRLGKVNSL